MQKDKDQQRPGEPNKRGASRNPQGQNQDQGQQRKDQKQPFNK